MGPFASLTPGTYRGGPASARCCWRGSPPVPALPGGRPVALGCNACLLPAHACICTALPSRLGIEYLSCRLPQSRDLRGRQARYGNRRHPGWQEGSHDRVVQHHAVRCACCGQDRLQNLSSSGGACSPPPASRPALHPMPSGGLNSARPARRGLHGCTMRPAWAVLQPTWRPALEPTVLRPA